MSGLLSFLKSRGLSPVTTSFNKKRSKHETLVSFLNNFILSIYTTFILIKKYHQSWREGSSAENISCSPRGQGFNSRNPKGILQPSLTPVPKISSSGLNSHRIHMVHSYTFRQNIHAYKIAIFSTWEIEVCRSL